MYIIRDGYVGLGNIYVEYLEVDIDLYFGFCFYGSWYVVVLGFVLIWVFYVLKGVIGLYISVYEVLLLKDIYVEFGDIICDDELMYIVDIFNVICIVCLSIKKFDKVVRGIYILCCILIDV